MYYYTPFLELLSYLINSCNLNYISVPVCKLCRRGQNINEKYDQCILYFLLDLVIYLVLSQISWCTRNPEKKTWNARTENPERGTLEQKT